MNSYKEIYSDYELLSGVKPVEINFTKIGEFKVRQSIEVSMKPKKRGITISLPYYLIFGVIDENILSLTIATTIKANQITSKSTTAMPEQSYKISNTLNAFYKKYKFVFTDIILDNVNVITLTEDKFLLTVFTIDGQIKQIEIDNKNNINNYSSGCFNKDLNIIYTEYLNTNEPNRFALGSTQGNVYVVRIENIGKQALKCHIEDEVKKAPLNFSEKISSMIPINFNIFSNSSKNTPDSISSIKYLSNNLIAYVTVQFNFKIYNFNNKKEVYSICLIKNRTDERLNKSKINFMSLALSEEDVRQSRSKSFIFTIYMEYNLIHVIQSFELMFKNIPEINPLSPSLIRMEKDFTSFYNTIDLGTLVIIKNNRVYKLDGRVIDMINYEKKIWTLSENIGFNTNEGESEEAKYDLRVFSIENEKNFSPEHKVIFYDSKVKNSMNIFNQIRLFKNYHMGEYSNKNGNAECKLLNIILANEELIPSDVIISYFNKRENKKYTNKSQIISYIQKSKADVLENLIKSILEDSMNNEIFSLGSFTTSEIDGPALVRANGISLIKFTSQFGQINNLINNHEYILRQIIFSNKNISKYSTHNIIHLDQLQSKIYQYITFESKSENANILYIILAMIRIYLTEANLIISDEKYLLDYFHSGNGNIIEFIKSHLKENLTNQFGNLTYLDLFHQIIHNVYLNNKSIIEEHIGNLLWEYEKYINERRDKTIDLARVEKFSNRDADKFSSKFCEILAKLIDDKIIAFFNISRDLLCFKIWTEIYLKHNFEYDDNNNKIKTFFLNTYSCYILSTHRCQLNNTERSIYEKIFLIEDQPLSNGYNGDLQISFTELTLYENISKYGSKIFHEIHNEYFDFIILNIWADIKSDISDDSNRLLRYEIIKKLFNMKEYKLISLLLKIQNVNNLENIFLDIICEVKLCEGSKSNSAKLKNLLNKYFSFIIDIQGKEEFVLFEDFYFKFFLCTNDKLKETNYQSNANMIITGYYFLEEELKKLLSEDLKYEFYFNCYTFIYPTLLYLEKEWQSNVNERVQILKIEEFLVNMIKSSIIVDIDLATSLFSTIKDNFSNLNTLPRVVEIFVDYIIKSTKNNDVNFIDKLPYINRELVNDICSSLEKKCEMLKDNANMIKLLKSRCNLEACTALIPVGNSITNSQINLNIYPSYETEKNSNYFLLLNEIYIKLGDLQKASKISFSYSEAINSVIQMNEFNLKDLLKIYKERQVAMSFVIELIEKIERSGTSSLFIIEDREQETYKVKFVFREDLERNKMLVDIKIKILEVLLKSNYIEIGDVNEIRNDKVMLNFIFKLNLQHLIVDYHLINFKIFDNELIKRIIINFIRVHIFDNRTRLNDIAANTNSNYVNFNLINLNQNKLMTFYEQVIKCDNIYHCLTAVETLLFINKSIGIPEILLQQIICINPKTLMDILIKYSRMDVKIIFIKLKF